MSVRADYYAQCAALPELSPLLGATLAVGTDDGARAPARDRVAGPAESDSQLEPGLTDVILTDVGDEPGGLPLLSTALLETWVRRDDTTLTVAGYEDAGGVSGALTHLAESVYERFSPDEQSACRRILLRLAEPGEADDDVRRRAPRRRARRTRRSACRHGARDAHRPATRHRGCRRRRGRPRGTAPRVAACPRLARGRSRGPAPPPSPRGQRCRLGGRRSGPGRALPRRPPRVGARLVDGPPGRSQPARAGLPRNGEHRARCRAAHRPPQRTSAHARSSRRPRCCWWWRSPPGACRSSSAVRPATGPGPRS